MTDFQVLQTMCWPLQLMLSAVLPAGCTSRATLLHQEQSRQGSQHRASCQTSGFSAACQISRPVHSCAKQHVTSIPCVSTL